MSKGRKSKSNNITTDWREIFNNNVGFYLQYISILLQDVNIEQFETTTQLLEKIKYEKEQLLFKWKLRINKINPKSDILKLRYKIPNNWNWFLLSEVAFYQEGPGIRTSQYREEGIKLLNVQNITQDKLRLDLTTRHISVEEYEQKYKHFKIEEGDILFASSGGSWGKTCWYENSEKDLVLNTSTMRIRTYSEKILLNKYLYLFLKTVFFKNQLIPQLKGMQPNFGSTHFNSISIPIPPISEQQKILEFLNDLENENLKENGYYFNEEVEQKVIALHESQLKGSEISTELNHQLNFVKKLRQQFLQEAVQGILIENTEGVEETGIQLLERIKAEKNSTGKKEKSLPPIKDEEIPFNIPENWAWCRLGEICDNITKGSSPNWQGVQYVEEGQGILFITSKNVGNFKIDLTNSTYVEEKFNKIESRSVLKKGDLLTNIVGASIGRTAIYDLDVIANINQAVCILRIEHENINKDYLLYLMNSDYIIKMMIESQSIQGRGNLSMGNIANFIIPLPPLSIQVQIVSKIEELMSLCDDLEANIKNSQLHNEQLLQQILREALGITFISKYESKEVVKENKKSLLTGRYSNIKITSMDIIKILEEANQPLLASFVWKKSEFSNDIEAFYAKLKQLIDKDKKVEEFKEGINSYLKLSTHEN